MRIRFTLVTIVASLVVSNVLSQPPEVPKVSAGTPPEFEVTLVDGIPVRVWILDPTITLKTKYGPLTVPVSEVRQIHLGFRYPEGVEAKINAASGKLSSASFPEREEAGKELLAMKELAVPSLKRVAAGADAEAAQRATALLKRLAEKLPAERMDIKDFDVVITDEGTIRGRLEGTALKMRMKRFGEAALKYDELVSFRSVTGQLPSSELTLDAQKYGNQGWPTWFDTGIDVSNMAKLEITCSGQIDQWSPTHGQYMSGPNGNGSMAPGFPNGVVPARAPGGNRGWMSGAVIGRIGPNGEPFLVGANFNAAKAAASGRLYLIIAPSNWNNDSVGSYKVRIKVGD